MNEHKTPVSRANRLRFNLGFLLEAPMGTSREYELNFPIIEVSSDVTLQPLTGTFTVTRTSEGVYASGKLYSTIITECVRCLDEATITLNIPLDDLFYYPPYETPPGEFAFGDDGFIDLAPLIRELSLLGIPSMPLCKPDCQGLCQECGINLNHESCDCEDDSIDPRLSALRKLLDD